MLDKINELKKFIGNTPVKKLNNTDNELYAKLEYYNFTGSIKDRAAIYIIEQAVQSGLINKGTIVIESSSGNFGIALATICRELGIRFIPVVDLNINAMNFHLLQMLSYKVVSVDEHDETGGYLLTRIKKVNELCSTIKNSFWPNQYANPNNPAAYANGLAIEIKRYFPVLDYLFISVSSTGTLMGVAPVLKQYYPSLQVIAVDIEGSVIFGYPPKQRFIAGMGSSKVPEILNVDVADHVSLVTHQAVFDGCEQLLQQHLVFGGGSSGAAYAAAIKFLQDRKLRNKTCLIICPDRGYSYMDTIYNKSWTAEKSGKKFSTPV